MAVSTRRIGSDGHASTGTKTNLKLTYEVDHSLGAGHVGEAEVSVSAANNNTMPPLQRQRLEDRVAEASSAQTTQPHPALADNVVPLPRYSAPRHAEETPLATLELVHPVDLDHIDVTVRRETATFRVPVSEARLPTALEAMIGQTIVSNQVMGSAKAVQIAPSPTITEKIATAVVVEHGRSASNALAVQPNAFEAPITTENEAEALPQALSRYGGQPVE